MVDDVFLCFGCGKRNRVSPGSNRASAKCGNCGEPLFPSENPSTQTSPRKATSSPQPSPPPPSPPVKPKSGVGSKIFWLSLIGIIGWLVYNGGNGGSGSHNKRPEPVATASAPQITAPQNLPPPVVQVSGIMWNVTGRPLEAPLRIETSQGADYYVKLIDATTGAAAIAIFVKGGWPLDVKIPLGSYHFRYASGETWRGESFLFGPDDLTSYNEAGDLFDFVAQDGYINGYTVELIRQVGGNLSTKSISPSQF